MDAAVGLLASTCMQQADEVADNLARDHAVCYGVGEPTHAAAGWAGVSANECVRFDEFHSLTMRVTSRLF